MALNLTGNDIIDASIIRNSTRFALNGSGVEDFKLEDDTIKLITTDDEFSIKLPSESNALTNDDIGTKVAPLVNGVVPSDNLPSNILTNDDIGTNVAPLVNGVVPSDKLPSNIPTESTVENWGFTKFSGNYNDLSNKPTLGTAAAKNYISSISNNSTDLPTAEAVYSYINSLGIENIIAQIGNIGTEIDGIEQKLANIFSAENKVTDFNTTTNSGIYYWTTNAANRPATDYGVLLVNKFNSASGSDIWVNQIAYGTNNKIYFRQNINSGNWTEWKAVAFEGEITANKVANALTVNGKTYDGSSVVNAGVQTVANGGTGVTTQADINKAFIGNLDVGNSDVTDGTEFISSWASDNGFNETAENSVNVPYKRKFSAVWGYIKGKISSVLGLTKDTYGGKASTAGTADYAIGIDYKGESVDCISAQQTSWSYNNSDAEWASYIICNHGDGKTYYHQMLRLPFFSDTIQLQRRVNGELKGWKNVAVMENENTWSGRQNFTTAKASNKMVIPIGAPSSLENGCIWIE